MWKIAALVIVCGAALAQLDAASSEGRFDPEKVARGYLASSRPGIAGGADDLALLKTQESAGAHHVRFQQTIDGLPVFGAYATVSIAQESHDVSYALDRRTNADTASIAGASIDRDAAIRAAKEAVAFEQPRGDIDVEQVYFPKAETLLRAWQVELPVLRPFGDWLVVVGADNGEVLLKQNLLQFDTGQVFDPNPVVTSGGSVPPPPDCDSSANATSLSAQYRSKTLLGIQDGQNKLKGDYVDLTAPGIVGSLQPAGQADEPSRVYNYQCNDPRFEEVMVYYHIDSVQQKIQSLGFTGKSSILAHPIPAHAHFDPGAPTPGSPDFACNAYYSPFDAGLHFGDFPPRCSFYVTDTAEDADWVIHEYGHAIQDDQVPGWGTGAPLTVEQASGMGEGFGDLLAAAITGNPCWSEWVYIGTTACAGQHGLRWLGDTNIYPDDFVACSNPPDLGGMEEPHCTGKIWGGALWDLVEGLGNDQAARDLALTLVLDSHFYLDPSATFSEAAAAIRQADIDLFGGAHVATIESVFAGRGIAVGSVSDFPYVYLRIRHTFIGDLVVRLKVGQLASPDCNILLWSPNPFDDADDLAGHVSLAGTACEPFLPPTAGRPWRLEVQDVEVNDIGHIAEFEIALAGTQRCLAADIPVAIPDNGAAVYSIVDCSTTAQALPTAPQPSPPTASPIQTPSATPTPTQPLAPTNTPAASPTRTRTPTRTPTPLALTGDANKDGSVNAIDAALVLQRTAGLLPSINPGADANRSGAVDAIDAALILQLVAGLLHALP